MEDDRDKLGWSCLVKIMCHCWSCFFITRISLYRTFACVTHACGEIKYKWKVSQKIWWPRQYAKRTKLNAELFLRWFRPGAKGMKNDFMMKTSEVGGSSLVTVTMGCKQAWNYSPTTCDANKFKIEPLALGRGKADDWVSGSSEKNEARLPRKGTCFVRIGQDCVKRSGSLHGHLKQA